MWVINLGSVNWVATRVLGFKGQSRELLATEKTGHFIISSLALPCDRHTTWHGECHVIGNHNRCPDGVSLYVKAVVGHMRMVFTADNGGKVQLWA
jgi:hypothetical protein